VITRQGLWRRVSRLSILAGLVAIAPACAAHVGKGAAEGVVAELRTNSSNDPSQQISRVIAARAVEGAVRELDSPDEAARIDHLVSQAASTAADAAVAKATEKLMAQLGAQGEGPLAVSFARTGERVGERVTAAALGSVGSELLALAPECAGPDPLACIEKRLQQTARTTAASFSAGVRETLGWQLLLVAFGLGAGGGVLGAWLWSLRLERRRTLRMA
jgi:hypothetical protein